jgi:acetyl-CoA carboxylase biotin carboxyl carrier protein
MTLKEIHDLIKLVNRLEIAEFKMREADFEISIRTKKFDKTKNVVSAPPAVVSLSPPEAVPAPAPATETQQDKAAAKPAEKDAGEESTDDLVPVKSPIVGTFYRSPSPDKPPYIKVGDLIDVGSVVCIVEAMKLFNEIESEVGGKIVKVMVEDASPVEYDQVLFLVDPNG